jgi:protein-disulfide isomerase
VCADKQGRFWEYHDQLFEIETLSEDVPMQLAKKLKLDVADFERCMVANESLSVVLRDQNEAKRLGIDSTPSFIINGEVIRGAPDLALHKN